mmetsp:Transcript_9580/g.30667  ORF Transcript_9580/g.30667 Transcript_9580/m.30667 type:complete len:491 (-) Transcript_9580:75-1547(-)
MAIGARWRLCWLLFLARGVCQANRVLLGALMPFLSADVEMTSQEKGSVLAAFSTGYMLTQVLGGSLADRFGGYLLVLLAITTMSFGSVVAASLLSASPAGLGPFWLCYFMMGLAEGPSYPTAGSILSKWIPPAERGAAMSIVDTGTSIASMCTFSLSPLLATTFGWQVAFRCFGYASLAICGLWAAFASNTPRDCPYMSDDEKKYLVSSGLAVTDVYGRQHHSPDTTPVVKSPALKRADPSKLLAKNGADDRPAASPTAASGPGGEKGAHHARFASTQGFPVHLFGHASAWATIAAHAAFNFGRYFVYNQIVTYYVEMVGTSAVVAGQQVLIGQVADTLGKFGFAPFVDAAIRNNPAAKTRVRKLVSAASFVVFALCMLVMAASTNLVVVTSALVVCKIASSAHVCGFKTSFLDLTSKHTGTLTGVSNTVATFSAMVSPLIAGRFLAAGPVGWIHTFLLIALVNLIACVVWVLFFSADNLDDKFRNKPAL